MTPKKLPSGKWRVQGYFKDPMTGIVSRPSFTADSKAEASRMVAEYQAGLRLSRSDDPLVKDCVDRYIASKESTLSPSTVRGYRTIQRNDLKLIENHRISTLTSDVVQNLISALSRTHQPKTVRNIYALLTSSISMFSDKAFKVTLPQKKPIEYHIPTSEDVRNLIDNASESLRLPIVLAATGTLRAGEVCALRYRDVDEGGIHVRCDMVKSADNEWVIKDVPKTSSSARFVPLPPKVMDMIGRGDPDAFVYGRNPAALDHAFRRLRDKLGLKCRFHDLRHFAASSMHALNIPDAFIQERGGWKSNATLRAVYTHALSDESKRYADIANDHFSKLL